MQKKDNNVLEDSYRHLFYYSPHPMWVIDAENLKFRAVNKAALSLYGFDEEEFLLLKISDLIHSSALPSSKKRYKKQIK